MAPREWGLVCALAAVACAADDTIFSNSPTGPGVGGGAGSTSSTDGGGGTASANGGAAGEAGAGARASGGSGGAGGAECDDAPLGWTPVAPCSAGTFVLGLEVADAACTDCQCGAWSGGQCDPPSHVGCWDDGVPGCPGGPSTAVPIADGNCHSSASSSNATWRCKLDAATLADAGSCPSSGGALVGGPWSSTIDLCDGCGCILQAGDLNCPEGFPSRTVAYASALDERSCSSCSCAVSGTSCTDPVVTVYGDANCSQMGVTVGQLCTNVLGFGDGSGSAQLTAPPMPQGGTCAVGGGVPGGAVTPLDPHTICCR